MLPQECDECASHTQAIVSQFAYCSKGNMERGTPHINVKSYTNAYGNITPLYSFTE